MNEYLNGKKLYGDDFDITNISKWFEEEKEGYANLGNQHSSNYNYSYHELNKLHGFRYLKNIDKFENALGLGAAYGHEFMPIINKIENLHIIESSERLVSKEIAGLIPQYKRPNTNGTIDFESNYFNLITSFGVLHHIPNITYVLNEVYRILKPGGYYLLREPIVSMGNWNKPRKGLTKNERGIPRKILLQIINDAGFRIVKKTYCFTLTSALQKSVGKLFHINLINYPIYLNFDKFISKLTICNYNYHSTNLIRQIKPSVVSLVLTKD